jgi:hypothetical protein
MVTVDVPQVQPTRPPSLAETTLRSGNAMSAVYRGQTTRPPVSGIPALQANAFTRCFDLQVQVQLYSYCKMAG